MQAGSWKSWSLLAALGVVKLARRGHCRPVIVEMCRSVSESNLLNNVGPHGEEGRNPGRIRPGAGNLHARAVMRSDWFLHIPSSQLPSCVAQLFVS